MKLDKIPKISIITPSFNQGQFLEETIQSVLNQNYPNLEYIIIDGGSTDNSVEIIKKYQDKIDYWISGKDKGQSDAINIGFHRSTGDILHWLNSDDVLVPGALKSIADFFYLHPEIDCLIGDQEIIDKDSNYLSTKKAIPFHFSTALYSCCMVSQPASPFTRLAWKKAGDIRIDLRYQMDVEYYLRLASLGIKFKIIKKPIAKFRYHENSKTVSEYDNLVWVANRQIQELYLPNKIKYSSRKKYILKYLNTFYRFRSYLIRVILRRELLPNKAARAMKRSKLIISF